MKRWTFIMIILFLIAKTHAQKLDSLLFSNQDFKPCCKAVATEISVGRNGVGLFNFTPGLNLTVPCFKVRYYITRKVVARSLFGIFVDQKKIDIYDHSTPAVIDGSKKNKALGFIGELGVERHFKGTKRLSPYIGVDLGFGYGVTGVNSHHSNASGVYLPKVDYTEKTVARVIALDPIVGADFYISKKVYVGVEMLINAYCIFNQGTQMTTTDLVTGNVTTNKMPKSTNIGIHNSFNGNFRLGYIF